MSAFVVVPTTGPHVLRAVEQDDPESPYLTTVHALHVGGNGEPAVSIGWYSAESSLSRDLSVDDARALAAELIASCDAIEADKTTQQTTQGRDTAIVAAHNAGQSIHDIAARYAVSERYVRKVLTGLDAGGTA